MALPALSPHSDQRSQNERLNRLLREFNRTDAFVPIYGADSGSATAYVITPVPGISQYKVGQIFTFMAANDNSGTAPTLNVNGKGAGTITYPDGSALVPGDIKANGFYTVQVTATTPTFQLMQAKGNRLLQHVFTETGAMATGVKTIPLDDTIPQSGEGDQYMSLSITRKSAASRLIIDVVWVGANSAATAIEAVTLFQDSGTDAIAVAWGYIAANNATVTIAFRHIMASGATGSTTFKVNAGGNGGTTTFNGAAAGRIYGGAMASSISIMEVLP